MSLCFTDILDTRHERLVRTHLKTAGVQLLIVDRQPETMLAILRPRFPADRYRLEAVSTASAALNHVRDNRPDVILLDPDLPDRDDMDCYQQMREVDPRIPVVFASALREADHAITAMKQGAFDYLLKPVEGDDLERVIKLALDGSHELTSSVEKKRSLPPIDSEAGLCGNCPAMREVYKLIGLVAAQNVNVLITGESGTGKELAARAIFRHSARANAPFLALNCAAIPEHLLESELFGHEKGAFSGADRRRIGKFEQYDGGTILLDEIGDMPLSLQAKILRLLQEQTFERVGGNETIRTNIRLIASTHRDLKAMSSSGLFRLDLYYRLSVFTIKLPPLRERSEDLPSLVRHFVRKYGREMDREIDDVSAGTLARLQQYTWPGNIRELQSVLQQAILREHGNTLTPNSLPTLETVSSDATSETPTNDRVDVSQFLATRLSPNACDLYAEMHRELDRSFLNRVLSYTAGNQHLAAKLLGIARQTLRLKLRETGIRIGASVQSCGARAPDTFLAQKAN